ncbi:MAG: hypothetical protein FWD88_00450 [Treponema sp.]|nr:hypothetical protein [Treponema sp.]
MMEKRFPFRLCIKILIISALLGLGALILLPLWRVVNAGMTTVRDGLIGRLELELGREIRFSSISPSILGAFDIRNVVIMGDEDRPVLTVSRFRVAYSIMDLLFDRTLAVRSVRLDTPVIDFDTARDGDILELFRTLGGGDGSWDIAVVPGGVTVHVRNGKLGIRNGDAVVLFETFNLVSEIYGSHVGLDARWNVSVDVANPIGSPVSLRFAMQVQGAGCVDSEEADGFFTIPYIAGDAVSTSPLAFALALRDGSFGLRKVQDGFPFDASLEYSFADGGLYAWLYSRNFRLDEFIRLSGGLESFRQALDVAVFGTASIRRERGGALDYMVDLVGMTAEDGLPRNRWTTFEIYASGDENEIRMQTLRLSIPETDDPDARFFGNLAFSGTAALNPFVPDGVLSLDGFSVGGRRDINAEIAIRANDGEIALRAEALRFGDIGFATLGANVRPVDAGTDFDALLRWIGDGGVPGSAVLRGSMVSEPRRLEMALVVDSFPVRDIAKLSLPVGASVPGPLDGFVDGTVVSTEIYFYTDFARMRYGSRAVVFSGGDFGGTVSFSGTDSRIELGESRLVWRGETLLLSGNAEFGAPDAGGSRAVAFRLNTGYRNLAYFVEGTIADGGSVVMRGSNGLDINLAAGGGGYSGHVRMDGFPIPFLGQPALVSVDATIDYGDLGSWSVVLGRFEVANMTGPTGPARVRVSGNVGDRGAVFPALFFEDGIGPLSGRADLSWYSGFAGRLSLNAGAESYLAEASFADGNLELAFSGASVRMYRFSRGLRNMFASGDVRLAWNRDDSFTAQLDLSSLRGRIGTREFTASARAGLDDTEIRLEDLRFAYMEFDGTMPSLVLSRTAGTAVATAELGGMFNRRPVVGSVALNAGFEPLESWADFGGALNAFSGRARVQGFAYGDGERWDNFDFVFSGDGGADGRAIAVSGGPRNMLRFRLDRSDNFFLALSSPSPVRGSVIGTVSGGRINARGNDLFVDLPGLFGILPKNDEFIISDGYVTASVDIRGTLSDPEFYGTARGTGMRAHVPSFIAQELRPVPFNAVFYGDELLMESVPTAIGTGAGLVTARFNFERWIPSIFSIDIAVPRDTPIPFDMNLTGFTARGVAAGTFNVSMEDRALGLSGNLWANHTEMGVNTDEIDGGDDAFYGARTPITANLTVTTGPAMEFFYPSSYFPLVRATPEMGSRIYISVDSLMGQFSVTGDVGIRRGEIFYFQRNFYIRSGMLTLRENEHRFEPHITARAELRERTADGPVTISMIVDNAPLASFSPRFESSPHLSQMAIFSILGQSFLGQGDDVDPMHMLLTTTADIFAQFTVVREFEQLARNWLRMDMFSIRTQALQNAFFMETGFMQPQQQVDITGRLGNYFDNTTIFMGRYLGQDVFFHGTLAMHYDAASWEGLTIQPSFGFEFQGPRFGAGDLRIRGDFGMSSLTSRDWTVTDPSVTFIFDMLPR